MIIRSLRLRNFRNYESAWIELSDGMNIITGENAQGKTNLLESLVYLSLTRSHRISDEKKLIREDMPFADIACVLNDEGSEKEIEAIIHRQGKSLLINRSPVKKSSDFIGQLNVVLFAPDDLYLFNDQPRERRRIMNQEITKISPQYLLMLNQYQSLLRERNIILKQDKADERYLDILDEQMAEMEAFIVKMRRDFIDTVNESMASLYREISGDDVRASVRYRCCTGDTDDLRASLLEMHRDSRQHDIERRMTLNGIHREDLIFEKDGISLINTASQGQKRMTMLAFKMALLRYIQKKTGKKPVLLLDDVLSELDSVRRQKLLEMVKKPYQCLITATEIPEEIRKENFREFRIENGTVKYVSGGKE